jgi:hypothetical protein
MNVQMVRHRDLKRVAKTVPVKAANGSATQAPALEQNARKVITPWRKMGATNVSVRISSGTARRIIVKLSVRMVKKHVLIANPARVRTDAGTA